MSNGSLQLIQDPDTDPRTIAPPSEVSYHDGWAPYLTRLPLVDAKRRAQDLPDEERERTIERLRRSRALIVSTDALERFDAWRAPEER
jgi:hypothetical protein